MGIKREDLRGMYIDATLKVMPNGEVVVRVRADVPGMETKRISGTKAALWSDSKNPPWQKPHLHKGMREGYFLEKGWMIAVWRDDDGYHHEILIDDVEDSLRVFAPDIPHNVLLGPEAEVVVWQRQVGDEPILNTDMQDRWPCPDFDFDYAALKGDILELLEDYP